MTYVPSWQAGHRHPGLVARRICDIPDRGPSEFTLVMRAPLAKPRYGLHIGERGPVLGHLLERHPQHIGAVLRQVLADREMLVDQAVPPETCLRYAHIRAIEMPEIVVIGDLRWDPGSILPGRIPMQYLVEDAHQMPQVEAA